MASFHVIGDQDSIVGFRFAGVTGTAVDSPAEALEAFRQAVQEKNCSILILTAPVAEMIQDDVTRHRASAQPPYVVVVGDLWDTPAERPSLPDLIYEAVGIRILRGSESDQNEGAGAS